MGLTAVLVPQPKTYILFGCFEKQHLMLWRYFGRFGKVQRVTIKPEYVFVEYEDHLLTNIVGYHEIGPWWYEVKVACHKLMTCPPLRRPLSLVEQDMYRKIQGVWD